MPYGDQQTFSHNTVAVLFSNPSAEQDINNDGIVDQWGISRGGMAVATSRNSDQFHAGAYSQKIRITAGQTAPLTSYFYVRYAFPLPPGGTVAEYFPNASYGLHAWLRTDNIALLTFKTRLMLCDASWGEISGSDQSESPAQDTWHQCTRTLDLGPTPNPLIKGVELRLYTTLASDNGGVEPSVWWDDLGFYDAYVLDKNPSNPNNVTPRLIRKKDRAVDNSLVTFQHPAVQLKHSGSLKFEGILTDDFQALRRFWLYGKPVLWTPYLPNLPTTMTIQMTNEAFPFLPRSPVIGAGYKGDLEIEEV